jgi:hypothetical protein
MLVVVVTKNTPALLRTFSGQAFRAGCAIAGAESLILFPLTARLKSCPDTTLTKSCSLVARTQSLLQMNSASFLGHPSRLIKGYGSGPLTLGHCVDPLAVGTEVLRDKPRSDKPRNNLGAADGTYPKKIARLQKGNRRQPRISTKRIQGFSLLPRHGRDKTYHGFSGRRISMLADHGHASFFPFQAASPSVVPGTKRRIAAKKPSTKRAKGKKTGRR